MRNENFWTLPFIAVKNCIKIFLLPKQNWNQQKKCPPQIILKHKRDTRTKWVVIHIPYLPPRSNYLFLRRSMLFNDSAATYSHQLHIFNWESLLSAVPASFK